MLSLEIERIRENYLNFSFSCRVFFQLEAEIPIEKSPIFFSQKWKGGSAIP